MELGNVNELRAREARLVASVREEKLAIRAHRTALVEKASELERVRYYIRLLDSPGVGVIHGRTDTQSR